MKKIIFGILAILIVSSCASTPADDENLNQRVPAQVGNVGTFTTFNTQGIANSRARYSTQLNKIQGPTYSDIIRLISAEAQSLQNEYDSLEHDVNFSEKLVTNKSQHHARSLEKAEVLKSLNSRTQAFLKNTDQCFTNGIVSSEQYALYKTWAVQMQEMRTTSAETPFNAELTKSPNLRAKLLFVVHKISRYL